MKRIFPDVIDAYDRLDVFHSSDDIELGIAYDEYVNRLPTFQEYFKRISNKKALEAGAEMGIVSFYNKSSNKKKIVTLRRIMNLFRVIQPRLPEQMIRTHTCQVFAMDFMAAILMAHQLESGLNISLIHWKL